MVATRQTAEERQRSGRAWVTAWEMAHRQRLGLADSRLRFSPQHGGWDGVLGPCQHTGNSAGLPSGPQQLLMSSPATTRCVQGYRDSCHPSFLSVPALIPFLSNSESLSVSLPSWLYSCLPAYMAPLLPQPLLQALLSLPPINFLRPDLCGATLQGAHLDISPP